LACGHCSARRSAPRLRTQAQQWAEAADREVEDVIAALEDALLLLNVTQIIYEALPTNIRRLVNQAVFPALTVRDPDTIDAQRTSFFDALKQLTQALLEAEETPQTGQKRPRTPQDQAERPQNDHDPDFRGRGSYFDQMAGWSGKFSKSPWPLIRQLHEERFGCQGVVCQRPSRPH
jgi:hypothetical protein